MELFNFVSSAILLFYFSMFTAIGTGGGEDGVKRGDYSGC